MDQLNNTENEMIKDPAGETVGDIVPAEKAKDEEFEKAVAEANAILGDDEDEAPTEHVPTAFEKKMAAIPEDKWKLYQIIGGVALGFASVTALFAGEDNSYMFLTAVILAMVLPNWFEKSANRKVYKGRIAMIITMSIGIAVMIAYYLLSGKPVMVNPPA